MPITEFSSIISTGTQGGLQMQCASRQFQLLLDEPISLGGNDTAMTPLKRYLAHLVLVNALLLRASPAYTILISIIFVLR